MFVNFSKELDSFQSNYKDAATLYKGKGISFLLGDVDVTQNAFQVLLPPLVFSASIFFLFHVCVFFLMRVNQYIFFCLLWQYFGLKEEQAPVLIIQTEAGQKYLKTNIEPSHIAPWLKDYAVFVLSF